MKIVTFEEAFGESDGIGHMATKGERTTRAMLMVIFEGDCWYKDESGRRFAVTAPAAIEWSVGDWVEYGSDGPSRRFVLQDRLVEGE